jgi:hypothetical protein
VKNPLPSLKGVGMATLVSISNLALSYLGHQTITSMDQGIEAARKCSLMLQPAIDATLRSYNWNCASARAALALSGVTPAFGWDFQYVIPNDCLRVIRMDEISYAFKVEGRFLLTNESPANILYIKRILLGEMDTLLTQAVAARLAMDLAFPLTNSNSLQEAMSKLYAFKIEEAVSIDAQEGTPDDIETTTWLDERL